MPTREQADLPYRSAITVARATVPVTKNEDNYDTLKSIYIMLTGTLDNLNTFNAFTAHPDKLPADRAKMLLHDIEINQGIYDILAPVIQQVKDAVTKVDADFVRRNPK